MNQIVNFSLLIEALDDIFNQCNLKYIKLIRIN